MKIKIVCEDQDENSEVEEVEEWIREGSFYSEIDIEIKRV